MKNSIWRKWDTWVKFAGIVALVIQFYYTKRSADDFASESRDFRKYVVSKIDDATILSDTIKLKHSFSKTN